MIRYMPVYRPINRKTWSPVGHGEFPFHVSDSKAMQRERLCEYLAPIVAKTDDNNVKRAFTEFRTGIHNVFTAPDGSQFAVLRVKIVSDVIDEKFQDLKG